ncbi:heparin lyase I family protein [Falsihalocynthiibacter sp. S25ZX9]|uniref:heparin lyase I family protein n=1 Tax=Falsihalocynthiibacter sp. S25ZX9 TaxID=3240870 RepID=UPI00350FD26E
MNAISTIVLFCALCLPVSGNATPLDRWTISCSVDKGAIKRKRGTYTFKTSTNGCENGSYNQRAEIKSEKVSSNITGIYLFETNVAMKSKSKEKFDIFQIHDGRDSCAPPLKVQVAPNGTIRLQSGVKFGSGKQCEEEIRETGRPNVTISRDGVEHNLRILIQFKGRGEFSTDVWVDGKPAVSGAYSQPNFKGAFKSKTFYFKHGVYSKNKFDYKLISRGVDVKKIKASQ